MLTNIEMSRHKGRWAAIGAAMVLLVAGLGFAGNRLWSERQAGDEPERGQEQSPAPALEADPALGLIKVKSDVSDGEVIVTDGSLSIEIEPPADATEMQVGIDPSFTSVPWNDVASTATLNVNRSGYQTCLLYTSPSPRDKRQSRMPSSA